MYRRWFASQLLLLPAVHGRDSPPGHFQGRSQAPAHVTFGMLADPHEFVSLRTSLGCPILESKSGIPGSQAFSWRSVRWRVELTLEPTERQLNAGRLMKVSQYSWTFLICFAMIPSATL